MGNYISTKHYPKISKRKFNKDERILLRLDNKIIDATNFVALHPGGKQAILKRNKQDITRDFKFHSKNARNLIKSMIVYELS